MRVSREWLQHESYNLELFVWNQGYTTLIHHDLGALIKLSLRCGSIFFGEQHHAYGIGAGTCDGDPEAFLFWTLKK
jgi:hypothetical protein